MDSIVPDAIKPFLRDRYLAGVADAEAKYRFHAADEDALTGALGNALSMPDPLVFDDGTHRYVYQVYYEKIGGRGPGAPEGEVGADGIFQIEVTTAQGKLVKGLPFQAKKLWQHRDQRLLGQCHDMMRAAGEGLVINYGPHGYTAYKADRVIEADGRIPRAERAPALGQILANEFLDCTIGQEGLFFDVDKGRFRQSSMPRREPEHVIETTIFVTDSVRR